MAIEKLIDGFDQLRHEVLDGEIGTFGLRMVWDQRYRELLDRLRHLNDMIEHTRERPDLRGLDVSEAVEGRARPSERRPERVGKRTRKAGKTRDYGSSRAHRDSTAADGDRGCTPPAGRSGADDGGAAG